MKRRLKMTDTEEVSLVKKGANKKKFLVTKSADQADLLKGIESTDPKILAAIETVLKAWTAPQGQPQGAPSDGAGDMMQPMLSQGAQTCLRAIARILAPFKNEITNEMIEKVLAGVGISANPMQDNSQLERGAAEDSALAADQQVEEEEAGDPSEVEGEMESQDQDEAEEDEEDLEGDGGPALGVQKEASGDDEEEEDEENSMASSKNRESINKDLDSKETQEGDAVTKQPILKADGSIDLAALPEETRPAFEVILKAHQTALDENKVLKERVQKQEDDLKTERKERRLKDMIAKADSFTHYTGDKKELANQLVELQDSSPKLFDSFVKQLEGVEAQAVKVAKTAFSEIGSQVPDIGDAEQKLDAMAKERIAKSAEKITYAKAYDQVLETPEGSRLYETFRNTRPGGV